MNFTHIHHISKEFLKEFYATYTPVFILNTGRSGSALLQDVFNVFPDINAHHEAAPNLFLLSNFAFQNQDKEEVLLKIFEAGRMELLLEARVSNKIYLETNQCLVFYIHQIIKLFPKAKFIHLTRHPGDFVRSAIRKGWHKNNSVWEMGRIKMQNSEMWSQLNHIEKLGWVWEETHNFIENFKIKNPDNCYTIRLEDLVSSFDIFNSMMDFIGKKNTLIQTDFKEIFDKKRNELIINPNEPENMFKIQDYPKYNNWSNVDKESLKRFVNNNARVYNYKL